MDITDSKELFLQVRTAHRLVVSYYKRVHQLICDVTNDESLDLDFHTWGPLDFSRPCQRLTNVFDSWEWDFVPGISTGYMFKKLENNKTLQRGDWLLVFHVISDTGISDFGNINNTDPIDLEVSAESARSVLRCYLVALHEPLELEIEDQLWAGLYDIDCVDEPVKAHLHDSWEVYGCCFEVNFENLTEVDAAKKLIEKIVKYRNAILPIDENNNSGMNP